jgi:hypothetical protein
VSSLAMDYLPMHAWPAHNAALPHLECQCCLLQKKTAVACGVCHGHKKVRCDICSGKWVQHEPAGNSSQPFFSMTAHSLPCWGTTIAVHAMVTIIDVRMHGLPECAAHMIPLPH